MIYYFNYGFASSQNSVNIIYSEGVILLVVQSKLAADWLRNRRPGAVAKGSSHNILLR